MVPHGCVKILKQEIDDAHLDKRFFKEFSVDLIFEPIKDISESEEILPIWYYKPPLISDGSVLFNQSDTEQLEGLYLNTFIFKNNTNVGKIAIARYKESSKV